MCKELAKSVMQTYKVIGVMSGTSLDGVDIAYCEFTFDNQWHFTIKHAKTFPYNETWRLRLSELKNQSGEILAKTDAYYGKYIGSLIHSFILDNNLTVDLIASHGHTIFHQPNNGFTTQIGCGANIYAATQIKTITNFRNVDVACSGQGAPLVPIGDMLLFNKYDACLNLGGFSNISFYQNSQRIAFDIAPCNLILNNVAQQIGFAYDNEGNIAASGNVDKELLQHFNQLGYYRLLPPKSLGVEWLETSFFPLMENSEYAANDLLATMVEHIAEKISDVIIQYNLKNILTTGGGAFNSFLIQKIQNKTQNTLVIPDTFLINFKEALIFAFLGVLRVRNEANCLQSVTGAKHNNLGGAIWG